MLVIKTVLYIHDKGKGVPVLKIGPGHVKMCLIPYANNKGADQPAHPCSMISTFVVHCLDSMICILALSKVSRF